MRVAVTGASGLVGRSLVPFLTTGGHEALPLLRAAASEDELSAGSGHTWNPDSGLLQPETLETIDAVVHLAGENVAGGRWTSARKRQPGRCCERASA